MLTVLLVRHGETVHNVAKLFAGITDSEYLSQKIISIDFLPDSQSTG
jgi:broad specificity phosphatase PhoE